MWSSGVGRVGGVYQMQIGWVKAATVGSGHQCLCVVLIKIEIYALPAFMGLGHCGDAYTDLPPPLSRQAGREADIVNGSLSSYPTSSTLSPPTCQLRDKQWKAVGSVTRHMHTVTSLIKRLPWRGWDVTAAEKISPGCLCQTTVCFKVIRSKTDNFRVNHEDLIHIHRSVKVLERKINPQIWHTSSSADDRKEKGEILKKWWFLKTYSWT